jgi:hypothetical protein
MLGCRRTSTRRQYQGLVPTVSNGRFQAFGELLHVSFLMCFPDFGISTGMEENGIDGITVSRGWSEDLTLEFARRCGPRSLFRLEM